MTTAKKADERAARKESGQAGGEGNAGGTAAGPGSSSATASKKDNQHSIGGTGSDTAAASRPGHKTSG